MLPPQATPDVKIHEHRPSPRQGAVHLQRYLTSEITNKVNEIHNLNLATRSGAEVSDQLKYFAERLPATFAYAGIDVERVGLFAGTRGAQIASRFATITTAPFAYGTAEQRR